jgi:RimJ/RimL family protein N-acetyltransferase
MDRRPEVHLRMLTSEDAPWLVEVDRTSTTNLARGRGWNVEKLAAELDEGVWASDDLWGWAIVVNGEPGGYAYVEGMSAGDGRMHIRISARFRGKGVGREVLRQLADHHFAEMPGLQRLVGRAHENNVPMQRAFNAAGFRMEARYRDSYLQPDGRYAAEWGYALTRADWEAGRHRADDGGYDLHGVTFQVEEILAGERRPVRHEMLFKFLQEGRRALARYAGGNITEGELAGIILNDVLIYRYVHDYDGAEGHEVITGSGRSRIQRRQDGRLEVVNDWTNDNGKAGKTFLVERR